MAENVLLRSIYDCIGPTVKSLANHYKAKSMDDVLHEVVLRLYERFLRCEEPIRDRSAYFRVQAWFEVRNVLRKFRRDKAKGPGGCKRTPLEDLPETGQPHGQQSRHGKRRRGGDLENLISPGTVLRTALHQLVQRETEEAVQNELHWLSPSEAQVVWAAYTPEGKKATDARIAQEWGCTTNQVARARKKILQRLGKRLKLLDTC